ncbi:MAG: hypothetical protein Q4Q06_01975 [Bacteroidota bacterium]|nr:hypothetical protein [Bacteroidota bacterium]
MKDILINPQMIYYDKEDKPYTPYVKARVDIAYFCKQAGFEILDVNYKHSKFAPLRSLYKLISHIRAIKHLNKGDRVWFEHPEPLLYVFYILLLKIIKIKQCKIFFITMDLHYLLYKQDMRKEINLLNLSDFTVLHAENMKKLALEYGAKCKIECLHFFPYHTTDKMIEKEKLIEMKNIIAFAGSLSNSDFLYDFLRLEFENIKVRFYGFNANVDLTPYKDKSYMGKFEPNEVSSIQAGWGLVWNGTNIDNLEGMLGEYLKYNAPHKMSLYLVAGMPVITHKNCGLAHIVEEKNLGITVSSLKELDEKIASISIEEYKRIVDNARTYGNFIRQGGDFMQIVRRIKNNEG